MKGNCRDALQITKSISRNGMSQIRGSVLKGVVVR